MSEKVLLRSSFVRFQGIIEYCLKVGGRGGSRGSVRHMGIERRIVV
jgi:hypothetical protein